MVSLSPTDLSPAWISQVRFPLYPSASTTCSRSSDISMTRTVVTALSMRVVTSRNSIPPGSGYTNANRISNAGQVVGDFASGRSDPAAHPFLYANGSFSPINVPGAPDNSTANGINDAGHIV